ncbi:MAG: chemotaxis protein CheA [Leptospiraceae bacterium]|nr:chemotaxis protein CheA [Leptospiraceae bacterium]MCP5493978.1 chemotaxis protein CheA [Leptospiraceae bacterium]
MNQDELLQAYYIEVRELIVTLKQNLEEFKKNEYDGNILKKLIKDFQTLKSISKFFRFELVESLVAEAIGFLKSIQEKKLQPNLEHIDLGDKLLTFLTIYFGKLENNESVDELAKEAQDYLTGLKSLGGETEAPHTSVRKEDIQFPKEDVKPTVKTTDKDVVTELKKEKRKIKIILDDSPPTPTEKSSKENQTISESEPTNTTESVGEDLTNHFITGPFAPKKVDDVFKEFITESKEILDEAESSLIDFENHFSQTGELDAELVNSLFREFHTIKGSSGFFNLEMVVKIAHVAESMMDNLRNDKMQLDTEVIDLLIETRDMLVSIFQNVETGESEELLIESANDLISRILEKSGKNVKRYHAKQKSTEDNEPKSIPNQNEMPKNGSTVETPIVSETPKKPTASPKSTQTSQKSNPQVLSDIRIKTEKLDLLLDIVGEMVIAESLVAQHPELEGLPLENFRKTTRHLHKMVKNLQEVSLMLRMVPLTGIFHKMERLIRDLSKKVNKKVNFVIKGEDTDVDKTVVELISDPLVHILRNSMDHGMESNEERITKGKPEIGTVTLEARHTGNEVWIMVSDDGRGLNREKIIKKAIEKGLVGENNAADMKDKDVWELLFNPGFSTADQVTDISGRGVGLDVVSKNLASLKGIVDIESSFGYGTTFILKLPLTLAIIDGMVIRYGEKYFIIPTIEVKESLSLKNLKVHVVHEQCRVVRYRDSLIPIYTVDALLNFQNSEKIKRNEETQYAIIIESKSRSIGVIFDEILGNQSIVIKPLSELFQDLKGVSGCTILGNGNISLILDVKYLVEKFDITMDHKNL